MYRLILKSEQSYIMLGSSALSNNIFMLKQAQREIGGQESYRQGQEKADGFFDGPPAHIIMYEIANQIYFSINGRCRNAVLDRAGPL